MLTIKQITENTNAVIRGLEKKHFKNAKETIDQVIAFNDKRRSTQSILDNNLSEVNSISKSIGQLMKEGKKEEAETAKSRVAELKEVNKSLQTEMDQAAEDMQNLLYTIPNVPYDEVPEGVGAEDNVVEKMGGMETELPKDALPHWELTKKYDLIDYIDYVYSHAPEQVIGIWGTSFGGATAGLAMGDKDVENKVDFLILDCPVSDMKWMVEEEMRKMDIGLPISYMTFCGNIINKMELGFSYDDANVCDKIADIEIPVLVINSEADTLTPQFMGQEIYDSIQNEEIKMIWTVTDSEHTEIWLDHNQEYREKVQELLNFTK